MKKAANKKSKAKAAVPGAVQTQKRKRGKKCPTISATEAALAVIKSQYPWSEVYTEIDAMANLSHPRRKKFSVKIGRCPKAGSSIDKKKQSELAREATSFVNDVWNDLKSKTPIDCSPVTNTRCGTTRSVIEYQALLLSNVLETVARLGFETLNARFSHQGRHGEVEFTMPNHGPIDLDIIAERLRGGDSSYSMSLHSLTRDLTTYTVEKLDDSVVVRYENA